MAAAKKTSKKPKKASYITVAALNVAAHPHDSPNVYEKLFRTCTQGPLTTKYHGKQAAAVSYFRRSEEHYVGSLVTFILLDAKDAWGNPRTGEEATEEELKRIRLPSDLHPAFRRHLFVFSPKDHKVLVDASKLSPTTWGRALGRLLTIAGERLELESVETTVEPTQDSVQKVLDMSVSRLTITLLRPNPDDFSELDAEVADRMEKQNVQREVRQLTAPRGGSIEPDKATKKLAQVAKSNGRVDAEGFADDIKTHRSTSEYPWTFSVSVSATGIQTALRDCLGVFNRIRRSRRDGS